MDILAQDPAINLVSLTAPEHGLDGQAKAGEYVELTPTVNWYTSLQPLWSKQNAHGKNAVRD